MDEEVVEEVEVNKEILLFELYLKMDVFQHGNFV
jgi:hypothetical protein